jgi:hypothetical protein
MNLIFPGVFVGAFCLSVFVLRKAFFESGWTKTKGIIMKSEIVTIYRRAIGDTVDFKFEVAYEYSVNGKNYVGDKVLRIIPTIFDRRVYAEQMAKKFPKGASVDVYYKPENPESACLELNPGVSDTAVVVISLIAALAAVIIIGVIMYMSGMPIPFLPDLKPL